MKEEVKKTSVKNTLQIHSQAKVEFYREYLVRYLRILSLSNFVRQINIFDVFCGRGIYEDGGKGSPIAAFDAIKELKNSQISSRTQCNIKLIINDKDKKSVLAVEEYIKKHNFGYCQLETHNKDIEEMFSYVSNTVSKSTRLERNLIFIDPYGYREIKKDTLKKLMDNGHTEIILFLPISFMKRFTNVAVSDGNTIAQYEPLRAFIDGFFPKNHAIRQSNLNIQEYIRNVSEALKFEDDYFTTSYYIERSVSNYFALFFISRHIYGFEKILDVKWTLDEDHGRGFNLPSDTYNLFSEDFSKENQMNNSKVLKDLLLEYMETPKTNKQLYEFVLRKEFLPKHANQILRELHKSKLISAMSEDGKQTRIGSYYINYAEYRGQAKHIITFKVL